jgi:hypothetical protein
MDSIDLLAIVNFSVIALFCLSMSGLWLRQLNFMEQHATRAKTRHKATEKPIKQGNMLRTVVTPDSALSGKRKLHEAGSLQF